MKYKSDILNYTLEICTNVDSFIDLTMEHLDGLRKLPSRLNDLIDYEIKSIEEKLIKLFVRQYFTRKEYFKLYPILDENSTKLNAFPNVIKFIKIALVLTDQFVEIVQKISFDTLLLLNQEEIKHLLFSEVNIDQIGHFLYILDKTKSYIQKKENCHVDIIDQQINQLQQNETISKDRILEVKSHQAIPECATSSKPKTFSWIKYGLNVANLLPSALTTKAFKSSNLDETMANEPLNKLVKGRSSFRKLFHNGFGYSSLRHLKSTFKPKIGADTKASDTITNNISYINHGQTSKNVANEYDFDKIANSQTCPEFPKPSHSPANPSTDVKLIKEAAPTPDILLPNLNELPIDNSTNNGTLCDHEKNVSTNKSDDNTNIQTSDLGESIKTASNETTFIRPKNSLKSNISSEERFFTRLNRCPPRHRYIPTVKVTNMCCFCRRPMWIGLKCKICKVKCHSKCAEHLPKFCSVDSILRSQRSALFDIHSAANRNLQASGDHHQELMSLAWLKSQLSRNTFGVTGYKTNPYLGSMRKSLSSSCLLPFSTNLLHLSTGRGNSKNVTGYDPYSRIGDNNRPFGITAGEDKIGSGQLQERRRSKDDMDLELAKATPYTLISSPSPPFMDFYSNNLGNILSSSKISTTTSSSTQFSTNTANNNAASPPYTVYSPVGTTQTTSSFIFNYDNSTVMNNSKGHSLLTHHHPMKLSHNINDNVERLSNRLDPFTGRPDLDGGYIGEDGLLNTSMISQNSATSSLEEQALGLLDNKSAQNSPSTRKESRYMANDTVVISGNEEKSFNIDEFKTHWTKSFSNSLKEWNIPFDQIEIGEPIGSGWQSRVYKGYWHGKVAIKILKLDEDNLSLDKFNGDHIHIKHHHHHGNLKRNSSYKKLTKLYEENAELNALKGQMEQNILGEANSENNKNSNNNNTTIIESNNNIVNDDHDDNDINKNDKQNDLPIDADPSSLVQPVEIKILGDTSSVNENKIKLEKYRKYLEVFKHEIAILRKTRHQNLVLFMGACIKPPIFAIVTSLIKGVSLFQHLHVYGNKFTLEKIVYIAVQIAQGMGYLHAKGIIHKDLRTKNVFLESGRVVISDFGIFCAVKLCNPEKRYSNYLSIPAAWIYYLAPELMRSLKAIPKDSEENLHLPFSYATDIFSYGTVLYELMTGDFPFADFTAESIIWQIGSGLLPSLLYANVSYPSIPATSSKNIASSSGTSTSTSGGGCHSSTNSSSGGITGSILISSNFHLKSLKILLYNHCWAYVPAYRITFAQLSKALEALKPVAPSHVIATATQSYNLGGGPPSLLSGSFMNSPGGGDLHQQYVGSGNSNYYDYNNPCASFKTQYHGTPYLLGAHQHDYIMANGGGGGRKMIPPSPVHANNAVPPYRSSESMF